MPNDTIPSEYRRYHLSRGLFLNRYFLIILGEPFSLRPPQLHPPQTFRMDTLLQEMRNIAAAPNADAATTVATAPQVSELALQGKNWDGVEKL